MTDDKAPPQDLNALGYQLAITLVFAGLVKTLEEQKVLAAGQVQASMRDMSKLVEDGKTELPASVRQINKMAELYLGAFINQLDQIGKDAAITIQ